LGSIAGHIRKDGYLHIKIDGKSYLAHRLAWLYVHGVWPTEDIDHRFHNTLDNRIGELRDVSNHENMQNRIKANNNNISTGLLGATFHKATGKYSAEITFDGKRKYLGLFASAEEAHAAYLSAKRIHHSTCTI